MHDSQNRAARVAKKILNDTFAIEIINRYNEDLTYFIDILEVISTEQNSLTSRPFEECENCITLLTGLLNDLLKSVDEQSFIRFKKQEVISKLRTATKGIYLCEAKFKS